MWLRHTLQRMIRGPGTNSKRAPRTSPSNISPSVNSNSHLIRGTNSATKPSIKLKMLPWGPIPQKISMAHQTKSSKWNRNIWTTARRSGRTRVGRHRELTPSAKAATLWEASSPLEAPPVLIHTRQCLEPTRPDRELMAESPEYQIKTNQTSSPW